VRDDAHVVDDVVVEQRAQLVGVFLECFLGRERSSSSWNSVAQTSSTGFCPYGVFS